MYRKEVAEIEDLIQDQNRWREKCVNHIAELIKKCIIEKRLVKEEVNWFSSGYQEVKCSFDELVRRKPSLVEVKAT